MKKVTLLCILSFIAIACLAQQTGWTSYRYNSDVNAMVFDGNYVWVGTNNGLVKHNRITGESIRLTAENSGVGSFEVTALQLDPAGNLWIGSRYGVSKLSGNVWTSYTPSNTGCDLGYIKAIVFEQDGTGWFGSYDYGLIRLDGTTWAQYDTTNTDLESNKITALKLAPDGNLWIGTYDNYIYEYDGNSWNHYDTFGTRQQVLWIDFDSSGLMWVGFLDHPIVYSYVQTFDGEDTWTLVASYNGIIRCAAYGQDGSKWLGTQSGLRFFNGTSWTSLQDFPRTYADNIGCLLIDAEANLWIGTDFGLYTYDGESTPEIPICATGLNDEEVRSLEIDSNDRVWISSGQGLSRFDGQNWETYLDSVDYFVESMHNDGGNRLWLTEGDDGATLYDGQSWTQYDDSNSPLPNDTVYDIERDYQGVMWFGTTNGLIKYYQGNWQTYIPDLPGYAEPEIKKLCADHLNNIWMIVSDSILVKFDGTNWTAFPAVMDGYSWFLGDHSYRPFFCDSANNLWMRCRRSLGSSSYDYCLARFDGSTWTSYQSGVNIPYDQITAICEDTYGDIWVGTYNQGLLRQTDTGWVSYHYLSTGLLTDYVHDVKVAGDGKIWVGTGHGLSIYDYPSVAITEDATPFLSYPRLSVSPNPFHQSARIEFSARQTGRYKLNVYNVKGQRVRQIDDGVLAKGEQLLYWDGKDKNGQDCTSGVYLIKLKLDGKPVVSGKVTLIRQ